MLRDHTKWDQVPVHSGLVFVDEILSILKCRNSDADSIQTVSTSTDPAHSGVAFVDEIFSILKCRNSDTETIKTVSTSSDGRRGCKYGASSEPDYVVRQIDCLSCVYWAWAVSRLGPWAAHPSLLDDRVGNLRGFYFYKP